MNTFIALGKFMKDGGTAIQWQAMTEEEREPWLTYQRGALEEMKAFSDKLKPAIEAIHEGTNWKTIGTLRVYDYVLVKGMLDGYPYIASAKYNAFIGQWTLPDGKRLNRDLRITHWMEIPK